MNTITNSSAQAVSRFLKSKGFERYNGEVGFESYYEEDGASPIMIMHRFYDNGYESNLATELKSAGFMIEEFPTIRSYKDEDVFVSIIKIAGRMAA